MSTNENGEPQETPCADKADRTSMMEAVAFVGETLAPLFLQDPATGDAGPAFAALTALDVDAAADAWPFVERDEARADLSLTVQGLAPAQDGHPFDDPAGELVREYRRLFVGPAALPAPPWGSVYTDRDCVTFGASTLELRVWMRLNGIVRTTDEHTPEDHIGLLLALLAYVARERPELTEEYLKMHVLTWASHYLGQLEAAARHPFYRGLARLTHASLEGMANTLGIKVVTPRFYR